MANNDPRFRQPNWPCKTEVCGCYVELINWARECNNLTAITSNNSREKHKPQFDWWLVKTLDQQLLPHTLDECVGRSVYTRYCLHTWKQRVSPLWTPFDVELIAIYS